MFVTTLDDMDRLTRNLPELVVKVQNINHYAKFCCLL